MKLSFHLVSIVFLILFITGNVHAWPSAIDWSEDNKVQTNSIHSCTAADANFQGTPSSYPEICHRWNLVWSMDGSLTNSDGGLIELSVTLNRQYDWNPQVARSGYRLPTIKELTRLFTYKGSAGIQDAVIKKWLTLGCNDQEAADDGKLCNSVEIELRDKPDNIPSITAYKEAYLISSTYRDIDGVKEDVTKDWNGRLQIMGVRISDGKVVTFEPGPKGGPFKYYANQSGMLALCEGFSKNNNNIRGSCNYISSEGDEKKIEYTLGADRSVVPIYALFVRETPLN